MASNLNSYLTYVLHNVNGRVWVLKCVCCGMGVENTTQYKYIYECTWYCSASQNKPWGSHICTYWWCIWCVACILAWCLGFSWSIVHVKPRAYKLEQGTYHTILNNKTNNQTYMLDSYIIHWQRRVYCICGHGHMCRRHDMWSSIFICWHTCVFLWPTVGLTQIWWGGVDCCGIRLYHRGGWMLSTTHLI
jgi:hypothetical protein